MTHYPISDLLQNLQAESLNQGGYFDWIEILNPQGLSVYDCLYQQLETIENERRAQFDSRKQRHKYKPNLDYQKLKINPWIGGWDEVWERTLFWCDWASPYHTHPEITDAFWPLLARFKVRVMETVSAAELIGIHSIEDNHAMHGLVFDQCSEDIVFETRQGLFILHFGIGS